MQQHWSNTTAPARALEAPVMRCQSRKGNHHQDVGTGIFLSDLLLSGSHEDIELLEGENKEGERSRVTADNHQSACAP
jgi:hypothetical protein